MKTLYYNGTVYTGEDFVEAFIVEDDRFIFSGSKKEAEEKINSDDEKVDLRKQFVCAGFNDSHMHLVNFGQTMLMARLSEHTDSLTSLLGYILDFKYKNNLHKNAWLRGRGWNQDYFSDVKRMPDRYDIDKVIDDIPVVLTRACGHCCVVNSKALELCGITEDTVSPDGGAIGKTNGKLNGLFFDNAIDLITRHTPSPSKATIKKMILSACKKLNSYGITSSQSDDYCVFRELPYSIIDESYRELEKEGKLTVRVNEQCNFTELKDFKKFISDGNMTGKGTKMFRTGPLKMLGDGSLGGRTAYLSQPYADDESTCGFPLFSSRKMNQMIDYANENGMQVAVHAIGDKCLDQVMNAIDKALNKNPRDDHRHGIVHCQISRADQLKRIEDMHLHVYAQSIFLDYDNHIVEDRVGKKLASTSYSWKTLLNNGVVVSNGSDAPVELPDVLKGIQCAVTRKSMDGFGPYLPEEAFTVREAIDSFTINGAIASFEEDVKGKIREGYYADFVILNHDPFNCDENTIATIKVKKTFVGGKCVYER